MNHLLCVSGGVGSRMTIGNVPKQYLTVKGKPVIAYTLERFDSHRDIDAIWIVADEKWHDYIKEWMRKCGIGKFRGFAKPGASRQESVKNGLLAMREHAADRDIVIVHDAVRPCTSKEIITECVSGFDAYDGVMPSLPVTDTCYLSFDGKTIGRQLPRDQIVAGQTPESYLFGKYFEAHLKATPEYLEGCRGSSQIAFENGMKIRIAPGSLDNFKITTKEDMVRFAKICGGIEETVKFD